MSQIPLMRGEKNMSQTVDMYSRVILEVGLPGDTWKYCIERQSLADKSEWFRALLTGDMAPPPSDPPPTISLQYVEKRAFDHLLRYIRGDQVHFHSISTARATLDAAHSYLCSELAKMAVDYLIKNLASTNVLSIYHGLTLYSINPADELEQIPSAPPLPGDDAIEIAVGCTRLLNACLNVIDSAADDVLRQEGFEELTIQEIARLARRDELKLGKETILFNALEKWSASECRRHGIEPTPNNKRDALSDEIWYSVRYLLMTDREFIEGPMASGILSSGESAAIVAKILGHNKHQQNAQDSHIIPCRLIATPRNRKSSVVKSKSIMKPGKKECDDNKKNRRKECASQGQRACARVGDLVIRALACVFD
ncbi:hypothetical protein PV327_001829 [Microctonus hyperodae]|uniref:BTB domain-containing protein n=1 Tax=Microctonus hyperodae TaxID=165561 RepID=A0AA39FEA9_MICHY|nr:hypothetical protein PV327_001829 [Microctonus hyperodae]